MSPPSPAHSVRSHRRDYKERPPSLEFITPFHFPLTQNHPASVPKQGEQRIAGIWLEPAAAGEEGSQRLEPPQEKLPVPGGSPSSTSSFARIADPRLSPRDPPTTPACRVRVLSRRRCPTWTMNQSRWIRTRSNTPRCPVPLCTPRLTDAWGQQLNQSA